MNALPMKQELTTVGQKNKHKLWNQLGSENQEFWKVYFLLRILVLKYRKGSVDYGILCWIAYDG